MKIDETGVTLSTLSENLNSWKTGLSATFGNDFEIRKEGVIDNIATSASLSIMDLENQVAFLIKQLNPETAEGEWQDKLYSLIGLRRRQATHTVVQRTVEGTPNATITAGTLLIENASTKDQFRNNADIELDATGIGVGSFTAEEIGSIDLPADATINIVNPLDGVVGVYYSAGNLDRIGQDYESDADFRNRWRTTSATADANTQDGLYKALLELVESEYDVKIVNNRTGSTVDSIPAHCMKITINSAEDDETIAQTIMDNIVDGNQVGLQGDISVDVVDSVGQEETIKFSRATPVNIYINVEVSLKVGYSFSLIQPKIVDSLYEFASNHKFQMGKDIYANIFANSIYNVEGVDSVTTLQISSDGTTFSDSVEFAEDEVPAFEKTRIDVDEAS